jgi:hypothetical protein
MTARTRIAVVLLVFAHGLAGCGDEPRWRPLPVAPTPIPPPPAPQPPPNREGYTLSPSPEIVTPEGELSVSWTAPTGGKWDWIGIFSLEARNCDHGWSEYTKGETSGTLTLKAPRQPGQYEFRYHLDDGCEETVRSSPVTVRAGG